MPANTTCRHGVMTGPNLDGEECIDCATTDLACLDSGPDCEGRVEYRMALSSTGKSFPRCARHWEERLDLEQAMRERYPEQPPPDWSPLDAGESWDED